MKKPYNETGVFVRDRARLYRLCQDEPVHLTRLAELLRRPADELLRYHLMPLIKKRLATQVYPGCFKTVK